MIRIDDERLVLDRYEEGLSEADNERQARELRRQASPLRQRLLNQLGVALRQQAARQASAKQPADRS